VIGAGEADLVSFAQLFLANPDLPARLAANGPFNEPDFETFYGGGEKGYSDYPALAES
ncbi:MAG: alkene reductase, partial [Thermoanaerobaculia bacterium]